MTRPSARTPITKAPMSEPVTEPRPPMSDVPPRTTAAIALSSKVSPVAGCAASSCDAMMSPTQAAQSAMRTDR